MQPIKNDQIKSIPLLHVFLVFLISSSLGIFLSFLISQYKGNGWTDFGQEKVIIALSFIVYFSIVHQLKPSILFTKIQHKTFFVPVLLAYMGIMSALYLSAVSNTNGVIFPETTNPFLHESFGMRTFIFLYISLLSPFLEEVICRGYLYSILRAKYGIVLGNLVSAVIFTALHGNLSGYIFLRGLLYAYVFERTESLYAPILLHVCDSTSFMLIVFFSYG